MSMNTAVGYLVRGTGICIMHSSNQVNSPGPPQWGLVRASIDTSHCWLLAGREFNQPVRSCRWRGLESVPVCDLRFGPERLGGRGRAVS